VTFLLHQLLSESAHRNPERIAVDGGESKLKYSELEGLSNQIARQLRADGICKGDRVGVLLPKSAHTVAALLGILKAGAVYVPVDPHSPSARAAYVLSNCSVRALVTNSSQLRKLAPETTACSELQSVLLTDETNDYVKIASVPESGFVSFTSVRSTQPDSDPQIAVTENDLAYILYTSGSTGQPKGVMISHLNSLTFVNWAFEEFHITVQDRVSSHAPFHFDLSIFDLFSTLKAGGTICLVPNDVAAFPVRLAEWISRQAINVWYSVPSALIQLVEHGQLTHCNFEQLRWILFAGEVFPCKYLRRLVQLIPAAAYCNLYGPTETNVCTYYHVQPEDIAPGRTQPVPIGKACANTEVFALDDHGSVVAPEQEGELYVRSSTVMKGYWGRPDATAGIIIPNPLNRAFQDVIYRTGDIVKLMPSGDYRYVGRRDKMVKSRGYRIELGEIETALYAHCGVKEAAVVAIADERIGARLMAYVVPVTSGLSQQELMKFCSERVPRYMVPERIELCSQLPKTSTGKIDKATLEDEGKLYAERTAN
jgi:amino acid adenylation domain-containing protein